MGIRSATKDRLGIRKLIVSPLQGYAADNINLPLLRLRNYTIGRKLGDEEVIGPKASAASIAKIMGAMTPFVGGSHKNAVVPTNTPNRSPISTASSCRMNRRKTLMVEAPLRPLDQQTAREAARNRRRDECEDARAFIHRTLRAIFQALVCTSESSIPSPVLARNLLPARERSLYSVE
jgi:hypothetical protein